MKLKIPDGLEKSERNFKLSPIIGQPKLPGIPSISLGERVRYINNKIGNTIKEKIKEINIMISPMISSSFFN
jgi:hypothetical protein